MDYLPIYICIYIPNCGEERREPTCVSDTHRPARMCRAVAVVSVSAEDEDEDASSDEDEVQHADGVLTRPASQEGRRVLAKEPPSFRNGQSCVAKACLAVVNAPLELTRANSYFSGSFKILLILRDEMFIFLRDEMMGVLRDDTPG